MQPLKLLQLFLDCPHSCASCMLRHKAFGVCSSLVATDQLLVVPLLVCLWLFQRCITELCRRNCTLSGVKPTQRPIGRIVAFLHTGWHLAWNPETAGDPKARHQEAPTEAHPQFTLPPCGSNQQSRWPASLCQCYLLVSNHLWKDRKTAAGDMAQLVRHLLHKKGTRGQIPGTHSEAG